MADWQPIETAPKDGTEVLIWREDCGVLMGRYCAANSLSTMSDKERDELDETSLFQEDWWGGDADGGGYRLEGSEVPTHWMPLPKEPFSCLLCHDTGWRTRLGQTMPEPCCEPQATRSEA